MAKCPSCGEIWTCSDDLSNLYLEEDEVSHCGICRCEKCRNKDKPKTDILDVPKVYQKMSNDWRNWISPLISSSGCASGFCLTTGSLSIIAKIRSNAAMPALSSGKNLASIITGLKNVSRYRINITIKPAEILMSIPKYNTKQRMTEVIVFNNGRQK